LTSTVANKIIQHIIQKWRDDLETEVDPMFITAKIQKILIMMISF